MNANFDLLDHAVELFPAPERSLDRLVRRRDRKRRNQRIGAAVLALAVAAAAIGGAIAVFKNARRERPAGEIGTAWIHRFLTEGHDGRAPIAADDTGVYTLTDTLLRPDQGQNSDVRLTRYDLDGNVVWARTFGTDQIDDGEAIALQDGSIFVAARTQGYGHYLIGRFEQDGTQTWLQPLTNPGTSRAIDLAVAPDGIYVAIAAEGQNDNLLRKYDVEGNELWTLRFSPYIGAVAADASGVYATFDAYTAPGVTDAVLRKFDPQGSALWTVKIERVSDDSFMDVAAAGGGVYATGWAQEPVSGQSSGGIFVQRYDGAGNLVWTRQSDRRAGFGILFSAGGTWADATGVYVSAFAPRSGLVDAPDIRGPFVRKLDPEGNMVWTQQVVPTDVTGEAVVEVAAARGRTFVSWEQGAHASPRDTDWAGFIEALGSPARS